LEGSPPPRPTSFLPKSGARRTDWHTVCSVKRFAMNRQEFTKDRSPGETVSEWAARFYDAAGRSGALSRKEDGALWITLDWARPKPILTAEELAGTAHNFLDIREAGRNPGDEPRAAYLGFDDARILFYSQQRFSLPILRAVVYDPVVVVQEQKRTVTRPGFDPSTGILYWLPPGAAPVVERTGVEHLKACFSGVPFERPEYLNNVMAFLLGFVTFDPNMEAPLLVVSGNQQGIGKSKTVDACGYILLGKTPPPVSPKGEEFLKQVGTRWLEGERFLNLDNVVAENGGTYKNSHLAQLITGCFSKRVRALGHNRSIEASGVVFAMSTNRGMLEADLASRALPVKLYSEYVQPMNPYVLGYAMEHRAELYGELLGLALSDSPPIDDTVAPNCRFRAWVAATHNRISSSFGPLLLDSASELSDAEIELYSWGFDRHTEAVDRGELNFTFTAQDLAQGIEASESCYFGLRERIRAKSKKVSANNITAFLRACARRKWFTLEKGIQIRVGISEAGTKKSATKWSFEVVNSTNPNG